MKAHPSLLPYQVEAVSFAMERGGRAFLNDEMGLGKTAQALTLMRQYPNDWPVLVVAPKAVLTQWEQEVHRWIASNVVVQIAREGKKTVTRMGAKQTILTSWNYDSQICICTYDIFRANRTLQAPPGGGRWRCVILDESHKCKDPSTKRAKEIMPVVMRADHVALLTGTPAPAGANDLWSQLKMTEVNGLLKTMQVRRLKTEVLTQLPEKQRHVLYLEASPGAANKASGLKAKFEALRNKDEILAADQEPVHEVMKLFSGTAVLAAEPCVEWVKEHFFEDDGDKQKIIVFAHHREVLDKLEAGFQKIKGATTIRVDGSVPGAQREDRIKRFKTDATCRVALLSMGTCSNGLNMTEASTILFAEMTWSPTDHMQAEDRIHRVSQTNACNIYYAMLPNSLGSFMFRRLQAKARDIREVVDGPDATDPSLRTTNFVTPTKPPAAARVKPAAPVTPPVVVDLTEDFEDAAADDEPIDLTQEEAAPALPLVTPETKKRPREPDSDDDSVLGYDSGFGKKARG
ncbi:annealing helicase [Aureococcus anophagefferens]|nr:annealing helicase [Aureococcus anophagefferens]